MSELLIFYYYESETLSKNGSRKTLKSPEWKVRFDKTPSLLEMKKAVDVFRTANGLVEGTTIHTCVLSRRVW